MNFSKHWAATLDDYAIDLAWSPDGRTLAAASAAGGITLYDAANGAVQHKLPGHADGTNALAWRPAFQMSEVRSQMSEPITTGLSSDLCPLSSGLLASGGQDGVVRFWDAATGAATVEAALGSAWVEHLAWVGRTVPGEPPFPAQPEASPYLLFAAAGRKLTALRPDGTIAHAFKDAPKSISALALTPSFSLLPSPSSLATAGGGCVAAAYFGGVCLWRTDDFSAAKEFRYGNAIHALVWSPDGRWLVAGTQDNAVHLWVPAEDLELHMSGYETKVKELSFSADSRWLATGGGRDVCVWDCTGAGPEGREPQLLPQVARTTAVAFQHRGELLATASADGVFTLWAPARKNPMVAEIRMPAPGTKFAWRADDALLAVGTEQGAIYVFRCEA
jgi:WD40 repeat protein